MLLVGGSTLCLRTRYPTIGEDGAESLFGEILALEPAAGITDTASADIHTLFMQAVVHCVRSGEYLIVEMGGWNAPETPRCVFALRRAGDVAQILIEAAPPPHGAEMWEPHIVPDAPAAVLVAEATPQTLEMAPTIMMQVIATWRVTPWDIALTFGRLATDCS